MYHPPDYTYSHTNNSLLEPFHFQKIVGRLAAYAGRGDTPASRKLQLVLKQHKCLQASRPTWACGRHLQVAVALLRFSNLLGTFESTFLEKNPSGCLKSYIETNM